MTVPAPILVDVPDGLGVVEVLGSEAASVLYLSGEPVWLHAYDNHGSVGELAARADHAGWAAPRPIELDAQRDWLADPGLHVDRQRGTVRGLTVEPLRPLLRLLARGRYLVSARTTAYTVTVEPRDDRDWFGWYLGYQDVDEVVLATDWWPAPGLGTIETYRAAIKRGIRPAVVLIGPGDAGARYVLDGHHKLAAYRLARVRPVVIEIVPAEPRPLTRELFAALVPEAARYEFRNALRAFDWA